MSDPFWRMARRRVLFHLGTAIRLAGFEISALSLLEALRSAPLSEEEAASDATPRSYLFLCIDNAYRRHAANELSPADTTLLDDCVSFWINEFATMPDRTRSAIIFDVMARLEDIVHANNYPFDLKQIVSSDELTSEDWDFI